MNKILLIDDDEFFRSNLRDALIGKGYGVIESNGGNAGLKQVQIGMPNIVITDVVMAEGIGTIMTLRQMASELLIIVMSGKEEYLRSVGFLSAMHMLPKPFHVVELMRLLDQVVAEASE